MASYQEILEKVPQPVKDKFLIKKRERAIEIVKEKISNSGKKLTDFDDDEIFKLDSDGELGDNMQKWLDGFVKKNF